MESNVQKLSEDQARKYLCDQLPNHLWSKVNTSTFRRHTQYVDRKGKSVVVFSGWMLLASKRSSPWLIVGDDCKIFFVEGDAVDPMALFFGNENGTRVAREDKLFQRLYPAWNPEKPQDKPGRSQGSRS